jgi:hypothetical protein
MAEPPRSACGYKGLRYKDWDVTAKAKFFFKINLMLIFQHSGPNTASFCTIRANINFTASFKESGSKLLVGCIPPYRFESVLF